MTRIHIVSLPHTLLKRSFDWCAYTAKVRRFTDMLAMSTHQALVYGPDRTDTIAAADYVSIVDGADRLQWFGSEEWDANKVFDRWQEDDECWVTTNLRAASAIRARWRPGDLLGLIGGRCQAAIVDQLADLNPTVVEWGIGYSGVLDYSHKVFGSYAWMHHVAGLTRKDDIRFFDTVIPNCFDPEDFRPSYTSGDFLLYMGRPNPRKGLPIIADIAKRTDLPVYIAGQPGAPIPNTEYVGLVTGGEKAALLAGARAVLVPTTYLEPFGGVAVEAMMSGTPVITTDWGAFTETVQNGATGFRCRLLREFLDAVDQAADLDRRAIHEYATERYSIHVGAELYGDYLEHVSYLHEAGWYTDCD